MGRLEFLHQFIDKKQLGIEIGPYHRPLAPKRRGYNSLSLDVFETAELRRRARADPNVTRLSSLRIEPVDLVGTAVEIARLAATRGLTGRVDYVLSSHNFEHLPDPIRFLQGCAEVLRPGGIVAMVIPDRRCTFDYFRPHSVTADFLAAYFEERERPTPAQLFAHGSSLACWRGGGEDLLAFSLAHDPAGVVASGDLTGAFAAWQDRRATPDDAYRDTHCWAFTPASCELILRDLRFLGLIGLDIAEVSGPTGCEFFIRLQKPEPGAPLDDRGYAAGRAELLHRINSEASVNALAPGGDGDPAAWKSRAAALEARVRELDAALQTIRRSASWRWTAPLRRAARGLRLLR